MGLVGAVALVGLVWAIVFFGSPGLVPRVLGTGGFATTAVKSAPRPYAFERPGLWGDLLEKPHDWDSSWNVLILGPIASDGSK